MSEETANRGNIIQGVNGLRLENVLGIAGHLTVVYASAVAASYST